MSTRGGDPDWRGQWRQPKAARRRSGRGEDGGSGAVGSAEGTKKESGGSFGSLPFVRRYNRVGRAANEIVWCRLVASNTTMIRRVKIAGGETTGRSDVRRLERRRKKKSDPVFSSVFQKIWKKQNLDI